MFSRLDYVKSSFLFLFRIQASSLRAKISQNFTELIFFSIRIFFDSANSFDLVKLKCYVSQHNVISRVFVRSQDRGRVFFYSSLDWFNIWVFTFKWHFQWRLSRAIPIITTSNVNLSALCARTHTNDDTPKLICTNFEFGENCGRVNCSHFEMCEIRRCSIVKSTNF